MTVLGATLLMLVGLLTVLVAAMVGAVIRRARWQRCRYRVFELRDQMVRLVAEGCLWPDDVAYTHTVRLMNSLITHMPSFTVREVAKGLLRTDEADHQRVSWQDYVAAVDRAGPEAAEIVARFWGVVAQTLYDNSVSLRAFVWLHSRYKRFDVFGFATKHVGKPPSWQAYRLSQSHARALKAAPV